MFRHTASIVLVAPLILATLVSSNSVSDDTFANPDHLIQEANHAWSEQHSTIPFDDQFAHETSWKSDVGVLDSSDQTVLSAMASLPRNDSYQRYGVARPDDELQEVDRRMIVQQEFSEIIASAVGDGWSEEMVEGLTPSTSFGPIAGYWIDQQDNGRLQIALVTSDARASAVKRRVEERIDELIRSGSEIQHSDIRYRSATYSLDDLYAVNRSFGLEYLPVSHEYDSSNSSPEVDTGVPVQKDNHDDVRMSASINVVTNQVDLYAETQWVDSAEAFATNYPDGLVNIIEVEAHTLSPGDETLPRNDLG